LKDHIRRQVRRDRGKIDDTVDVVTEDGYYVRFKPLIITRARVKSSQKQEMRTIARDVILTTGASMTWLALQKAVLDSSIENTIKESVSKIQPVRTVIIRRTQLLQSGVLVEDGPTLDEIHAQESADAEEAKIRDALEIEEIEDEEESEEEVDDNSDEIVEDSAEPDDEEESEDEAESESIDYSSMKVVELKELLKSEGKPVSGKKSDLIDRLNE